MLSSPDWKLTLVTNHQISLQGPTKKCPCSAQPQSIPAVPNPSIPAVPNRRASLQCPTAKHPYTAQPQSIPAVAKYPRSAQPQSIPAVPNCKVSLQCRVSPVANHQILYPCRARKVSLQCPAAEYPWSAQQQSINILAARLQCCKEDS